jgi:hypothetical protein
MIFKIVGFGVFDGRSRRDILPGIGAEVPTLLEAFMELSINSIIFVKRKMF